MPYQQKELSHVHHISWEISCQVWLLKRFPQLSSESGTRTSHLQLLTSAEHIPNIPGHGFWPGTITEKARGWSSSEGVASLSSKPSQLTRWGIFPCASSSLSTHSKDMKMESCSEIEEQQKTVSESLISSYYFLLQSQTFSHIYSSDNPVFNYLII